MLCEEVCSSGSGNGEQVPEQAELGDMRRPIGLSGYIWYEWSSPLSPFLLLLSEVRSFAYGTSGEEGVVR